MKCPQCQRVIKFSDFGKPLACTCRHASRYTRNTDHGDVLKVHCERCGADNGERCRGTKGGFSVPHSERRRQFEAIAGGAL